jgi:hypothetical protein
MYPIDMTTAGPPSWLRYTELHAKHSIFDVNKSTTWSWPSSKWTGSAIPLSFRRQALEWDVQYGDGSSASGLVGYDDVQIGNLTIAKQAVQVAQNFVGKQFRDGTADGIFGLAFGHINSVRPQPVKTVLESMIEQDLLQEQLFTIN